MPDKKLHLRITSESHPGRKRSNNEDRFAVDERLGIIILADGMGGHLSGEVASEIATRSLMSKLRLLSKSASSKSESSSRLIEGIKVAITETNFSIYQAASSNAEHKGMGTTVVAIMLNGSSIHVGHVGDSRLYCFRRDKMTRLTTDHSLVQDLVDRGLYTEEQARSASVSHIVTRSLGLKDQVEVDVLTAGLKTGDHLLICTDGLTDMVADWQIREILKEYSYSSEAAVQKLVEAANHHGGRDNISVILAHVCTE